MAVHLRDGAWVDIHMTKIGFELTVYATGVPIKSCGKRFTSFKLSDIEPIDSSGYADCKRKTWFGKHSCRKALVKRHGWSGYVWVGCVWPSQERGGGPIRATGVLLRNKGKAYDCKFYAMLTSSIIQLGSGEASRV